MSFSIMIVDSHTIVREGLISLFVNDSNNVIIDSVSTGRECLKIIKENVPDIIISDTNLSDMDGLTLFNEIKSFNRDIKVIFLTEDDRPSFLLNAFDAGVEGYLRKSVSFKILKTAIKEVCRGKQYIETDILPMLNKNLLERDTHEELLNKLTKRETQMLICVTNGLSNKEIASECKISERTVKNHLSSVFQKIDVADRTQAAVFAIKTNLVKI